MSRDASARPAQHPPNRVDDSMDALSGHSVRHWHTATFRWLIAYAIVFCLSFIALGGLLEYCVEAAMERVVDSAIRWQLRYYDSVSDADLAPVIARRLEHEKMHTNYYGLFAHDGRRIVGDIEALPTGVRFDEAGKGHGATSGTTRAFASDPSMPTLRLIGEVREDGSWLVVGRGLADVEAVREELNRALIGGGLLCLTVLIVVGLQLGLRQARRVSAMQHVTARIGRGELAQRLPVDGRDELDMLARLVNHMLDEIERLMSEVKGACDGIAHDLRTPLVRLRVQLSRVAEVAAGSGDRVTYEMIADARTETDFILARFSAMLRISEISSLQRRTGFELISLQALVAELSELYLPLAEEKSIELYSRADAVDQTHADRALLFEAFSNLLDNAINFAPDGGTVCVELRASQEGPQLVVSDNGPGIPVSERDSVLSRFYRGEQTGDVSSTGLRLGIVSAILHLHDFAMRLSDDETGTTITVDCWPRHFH